MLAANVRKDGARNAKTANLRMTLPILFDIGRLPTYN
jgi:hypothetical protein